MSQNNITTNLTNAEPGGLTTQHGNLRLHITKQHYNRRKEKKGRGTQSTFEIVHSDGMSNPDTNRERRQTLKPCKQHFLPFSETRVTANMDTHVDPLRVSITSDVCEKKGGAPFTIEI